MFSLGVCMNISLGVVLWQDGKMVRTLKGHGHWVNTLALSSEYVLRTGPHDHHGRAPKDPVAAKQARIAA